MPLIMDLGYVELGIRDAARSIAYYNGVLGANISETSADGTTHLSLGNNHHCLIVKPSDAPGLGAVGLQLRPPVGIQDAAKHLATLGLAARIKSDSRPGMPLLLEVEIPGGHVFEFYESMMPVVPHAANGGILPRRLGHVAILSSEAKRLVQFFREGLDCWATDWFEDRATFLTCNHEHHVFNVAQAPISGMHHVAFQLKDASHHFDAADVLAIEKVPLLWGPSRHTAGHNIASYHRAPEGSIIELYTDMDIYLPEVDAFEYRPYHEHRPQKPKVWQIARMSAWRTEFSFDLAQG